MAKKTKKRASVSSAGLRTESHASLKTNRSFSEEFNPDYHYVIQDLKRIGALAGSFFVILIALSFILK